MNSIGRDIVSWSKTGLIAYGDSRSPEGNLCITFLECINGTNWRFHPIQRYIIHPQLHETGVSNGISSSNGHHGGNGVHTSSGSAPTTSITSGGNIDRHSRGFFYNLSSVHWNNWFSLPGDMLAVCDEVGNMTMLISGQTPEGPSTIEKLTMLFQDNVYKIHNQILPLHPSTPAVKNSSYSSSSSSSSSCLSGKMERKQTKKEYHTTILSFHWLSSSKPVICSQFCVFDVSSNCRRNKAHQIPPFGVFHPPFMKYACMAVRKNGQIDFWYQFSNSKDHKKITLQLQSSQNQRMKELDWLEYVKITPINEDQCVLVSTYSKYFKRLSFYRLHINWNVNSANPAVLNDPSLKISHILDTVPDTLDDEGKVLMLTHLYVLSKNSMEKNPYPEILLVYDVIGTNNSLLKRFRLIQSQLAPNFVNILKAISSSKRNDNTGNQSLRSKHCHLLQTGSMTLPNRVVSVTSEMLDGFTSFYFQDGSITTYNQNDWKPENERLKNQNKQGKFRDMITSILSADLQFPKIPPSAAIEWARISPSMGGVIVKLEKKRHPSFYAIQTQNCKDSSQDAINAATLAFGFVASTHRQLSSEDLSIACKTHVIKIAQTDEERARNLITTVISCIYSFFNVTPDAPKEIMDKMISSRPIQKTILLQLELGYSFKRSNIYGMSRVIMSLRNVLFAFNGVSRNLHFAIEQLSNSTLQQSTAKAFQTSFSKQDLVHSLIPIAKWFVKFVTYLIQEVILLINDPNDEHNTLVLGVFGARMPRTLILSILNEVKKVTEMVSKFPETSYPVLNESSKFLKMVLGESPVNFEKFETFLVDVNNKFSAFNEQQPSNLREPSLLVKAEIPSDVRQMGDFLLAYSNNAVISHVDTAAVYFTDTSELRISYREFFNDRLSKLLQPIEKGLVIDTNDLPHDLRSSKSFCQMKYDTISFDKFSNEELLKDKFKRCCRCGCVTRAGYAISPNKTVVPTNIQTKRWPTMYTRICICSGFLYELNN